MYSKIIVRSYADMLALNPSRDNFFISVVEGCSNELVNTKTGAHFPLSFPDCGGRDALHCPFTDELAKEIVDFILNIWDDPEEKVLYINCMAGKSRSGAIATFAAYIRELNEYREPGAYHHQRFMERFKNENPQIVPNMHILYKLLREYFSRGQ